MSSSDKTEEEISMILQEAQELTDKASTLVRQAATVYIAGMLRRNSNMAAFRIAEGVTGHVERSEVLLADTAAWHPLTAFDQEASGLRQVFGAVNGLGVYVDNLHVDRAHLVEEPYPKDKLMWLRFERSMPNTTRIMELRTVAEINGELVHLKRQEDMDALRDKYKVRVRLCVHEPGTCIWRYLRVYESPAAAVDDVRKMGVRDSCMSCVQEPV